MSEDSQQLSEACVPVPIRWEDFNDQAQLQCTGLPIRSKKPPLMGRLVQIGAT